MRDAAIERLSKLVSDIPTKEDGSGDRSRKPLLEMHIGLAEGWFSLILLAIVVYSTIWCVQAVGWVDHLGVLTPTTFLGLVAGVVAAKQNRLPRFLVHGLALLFALLFAFWQSADNFYQGSAPALINGVQHWIASITVGGIGDVDAIFFFFIVALSFLLAYTSAWLVYRTRSPWLMVVANAVVLLINLDNASDGFIFFLVIFLIASLLLLLRFNLYESMRVWQKQGLRYAEDLGWDVMQAGALISIGILIFSWVLPGSYMDPTVSQIWNANSNPWTQLQNTWNRVISVTGGSNPANRGNFRDSLALGGNPNLTNEVVMTVKVSDTKTGNQYLASLSYDSYDGRTWTDAPVDTATVKANATVTYPSISSHQVTQKITVVNPPGEQYPYLLGASEIATTSVAAKVQENHQSGIPIAWLGQNGYLVAGASYSVTSNVSSADEPSLRTILMPQNAPTVLPPDENVPIPASYYNPAVLSTYTQLPKLDPRIAALAQSITRGKTTMYDKVVALETYLRTHYTYSVDIHHPASEEGVAWFLFDNANKNGFCNYFSSAMTIMARSLGIPARVTVGYTSGTYDAVHKQSVIRGTDAHSWTQVYFAGYGWVNFEPSASFAQFTRPLPNQFPSVSPQGSNSSVPNLPIPSSIRNRLNRNDSSTGSGSTAGTSTGPSVGVFLGGFVLLLLFACLSFSLWWRRLFRNYALPIQLYGRVCMLASWAGIQVKQSQTPYEYVQELALSSPGGAETLEKLGDIYVRDRWADPASEDHPRHSGEIEQLPGIWKRLQPHLILYVLRHPHFLRWLPQTLWGSMTSFWKRRRARHVPDVEDL
jgi:transglutaminase-like putative cysteine protease